MRGRPLVVAACTCVAFAFWDTAHATGPRDSTGSRNTPPVASIPAHYREVLDTYCVTCHNQRLQTGGVTLQSADLSRVAEDSELWEKVVRKLRVGTMPPQGARRPDRATADALSEWLEGELDRAAAAKPDPGRPIVRRLNRTEYANAVRDLLALDVDVAALLPPDDSSYG